MSSGQASSSTARRCSPYTATAPHKVWAVPDQIWVVQKYLGTCPVIFETGVEVFLRSYHDNVEVKVDVVIVSTQLVDIGKYFQLSDMKTDVAINISCTGNPKSKHTELPDLFGY